MPQKKLQYTNMKNTIQYNINTQSDVITIYLNGFTPTTVDRSHASYSQIMAALIDGRSKSEIEKLIATTSKIEKKVDWSAPKLKSQGAEVINGKLFIDGREQSGRIAEIATEYAKKTGSIEPVKRFLERLDKNPSSQSKAEAWDFLQHRGLPIMPDGMVRGYKGVNSDGWSKTGNLKTRVLQGEADSSGRIKNVIGGIIEVARGDVDDVRSNKCSHGLHVGTYEYARTFAPLLLLVEFDPADIVSVPTDCNCQKLRCSKYKVIEEYKNTAPIPDTVVGYDIEEIDDFLGDLFFEDDIPMEVTSSTEAVRKYARAKVDEAFDEVLDNDFETAYKGYVDDARAIVEANRITGMVSSIQDRVTNYVNKKGKTTLAAIQKALNPTTVGVAELNGLVKRLGFKVKTTSNGVGSWIVTR